MDRAIFMEGRMIASPIVEAIKATNPQFRICIDGDIGTVLRSISKKYQIG